MRMIAISATIPNIEDLSEWLSTSTIKHDVKDDMLYITGHNSVLDDDHILPCEPPSPDKPISTSVIPNAPKKRHKKRRYETSIPAKKTVPKKLDFNTGNNLKFNSKLAIEPTAKNIILNKTDHDFKTKTQTNFEKIVEIDAKELEEDVVPDNTATSTTDIDSIFYDSILQSTASINKKNSNTLKKISTRLNKHGLGGVLVSGLMRPETASSLTRRCPPIHVPYVSPRKLNS
eukprot:UC4_evm2s679